MLPDLEQLSVAELEDVIADAKNCLKQRHRSRIRQIYTQYVELATTVGMSVDELIASARGEMHKPITVRKLPARYQHPTNPAKTWSGVGKPPLWMTAQLAQGASKEDFLIPESA